MPRFSLVFKESRSRIDPFLTEVLNADHIVARDKKEAIRMLKKDNPFPVTEIMHIEEIKGEVYYGKSRK